MYISDLEEYNGQIFGLIKVTDYINDLLDGKVYMNTLEKYIDMEKESGIKGMGDRLEASHVFKDL